MPNQLPSRRARHLNDLGTFFLVALAGASVNFGARLLYSQFIGNFELSVACAYLSATLVGFALTKRFAFNAKGSGNTYREMAKFTLVSLLALAITVCVASFALQLLNRFASSRPLLVRETLAHLTGMGFSFVTNFLGHKLFTFKTTGVYNRVALRTRR